MYNKQKEKVGLPRLLFMIILTCIILFVFNQGVFAAITGKIAGTVKDSETGESLPGTNIILLGTEMGAATDIDGDYFILNVPPGVYSLQARMMGYENVTKTEIAVSVDRTIRVNFELEPTAIEVPGITVVARKPIIKEDVSATQINIKSDNINATPINTVTEMLAIQAGSEVSYDLDKGSGISIRGGDIGESDFQVDGISLKNELTDVSHMNISRTSIEEVQLLTGGFNAEYGGIRSGLINTITKKVSPDKYSGSVMFTMSPPGRKHFGPHAYDQNGRIWDVFAGPKAFEGVTGEDVDLFERTNGDSGYAFEFAGWDAISAALLADDDPTNDLTPQQCLETFKWRHRPREYGDESDYDLDVSFGGPLILEKTTFLASYRRENYLLVYPLSRKNELNETYQFKLSTQDISPFEITIDGIYGTREGCTPACFGSTFGVLTDNSWGPVAGNISGSRFATEFTANAYTSYGSHRSMYVPAWWPIRDDKIFRLGLKITHTLSPSTFYSLQYQFGKDWIDVWHLEPRDTSDVKQIGDKWYDETPQGWNTSEMYDQAHMFLISGGARYSNESSEIIHRLDLDFTSQVNKYNEVKAGFGLILPSYKVRSCYFTYTDTAQYNYADHPYLWQWWDESPVKGHTFIQDKFEWKGMIANFGLRIDFMNPRTEDYERETPYDKYYTRATFEDDEWYVSKQTKPVETKIKIQPRIGVSYPISVYSKIYFNYGHFYQEPNPYYLYSKGLAESGPGFLMPSPNLDWPRTIAYEVGIEQNIADMFLVHIAGYLKDITGEFMLVTGVDWDHTVRNQYWTNNRYSDIKGIELRLEKPWGKFVTFWSNYNYMITSYGYSTLPVIYENPLEAEAQEANAEQIKPIAIPEFRAGINLFTPKDWGPGPEILGARPFGGIQISLLYRWNEGGEFIFNPEAPIDMQHWVKEVSYSNTDLKVEKTLSFGVFHGRIFMDVYNLFNQKYLYTGGWTSAEYQAYRNSLQLPWEEGEEQGNDRWGDWDKEHIDIGWHNWMQFLNPRDIFFGISLEF
jgi:outer membrane receptor protein involved in Fe transport